MEGSSQGVAHEFVGKVVIKSPDSGVSIVLDASGNEAGVQILDRKGQTRVAMSYSAARGPGLEVSDGVQKGRVAIGMAGREAALAVFAPDGRPSLELRGTLAGPSLTMLDSDGNECITLGGAHSQGLMIRSYDAKGDRVSLIDLGVSGGTVNAGAGLYMETPEGRSLVVGASDSVGWKCGAGAGTGTVGLEGVGMRVDLPPEGLTFQFPSGDGG